MTDLNATLQFLTPYYSTVEQVVGTVSLLVGGIFGIYLLSFLVKIFFYRRVLASEKRIESRIESMEKKIDALGEKKKGKS